ncbi:MAG: endopeptidase La [Planctomycetes bacterium]|nr:endopeptidase La [Planctomycetota bacterium]MCB9904079.1 endopeptidase La [Planctomycetota bacterium]
MAQQRRKKSGKSGETRVEGPSAQDPSPATNGTPAAGGAPELPADQVHIVPVRNMVLFPGVVLPLMIGRERSILAIQEAVQSERPIGLLLQRKDSIEEPGPDDLYQVGTLAEVVRYMETPDGSHHAVCQGKRRFRVLEFVQQQPVPIARVEFVDEPELDTSDTKVHARFVALKQQAQEVLAMAPGAPEDLAQAVQGISSPSSLTDLIATFMDVPVEERQEVLETFDVRKRLKMVADKLGHVAEVLRLSAKIRQETQQTLEKAQREYYLREQLRAIQNELGEGDEKANEVAELTAKISKAGMPADVEAEALKELRRLERMPEGAAEGSIVRSYLELMTELPWSKSSTDRIDLKRARRILNQDHFGLEEVKQRILEFLAIRKLRPDGKNPSLLLVGPPGVGKTSLGKSIARAMGREFVRVSLGGVHDESEVRGHRRTYVGALPGNVIQGIRRVAVNNPVFMLDEMDKLGRGMHGDPSSALLEVLDPEQNSTFRDNYLGVTFDLHQALFIGTANVLEGVPGPLRDRFEVIQLPGYTEAEKLQIGHRYLVRRQLENTGLDESQCEVTEEALLEIIRHYTREAGVRGLERKIGSICRHAATKIVEGSRRSMKVRAKQVREILGPHRFESEIATRTCLPGVATGLAWTPVGGEILFIEATTMPGKGGLTLTGQLGDVMKESARTAMSLAQSHWRELGLEADYFQHTDVHLHIPAGAIPKDGPSAGVAMYTALISLFTARVVRSDLAMTGEISLRGLVLPVGGIKEKLLGALAAGIKTVVLPKRNQPDVEEIEEKARKGLQIRYVDRVDQAVQIAFEHDECPPGKAKSRRRATRTKS